MALRPSERLRLTKEVPPFISSRVDAQMTFLPGLAFFRHAGAICGGMQKVVHRFVELLSVLRWLGQTLGQAPRMCLSQGVPLPNGHPWARRRALAVALSLVGLAWTGRRRLATT